VTRWNPGDGDHEVVSLGSDKPPRPPGRLLIGVAAASVALGFMVGMPSDVLLGRGVMEGASAPVAAGAVDLVAGPWDEPVFRVPVFNAGEEEIEVTIVGLRGWASRPRTATAETIAPDAWEAVRFSARPDCASPPAALGAVYLRVTTATTRYDRAVALPGRAAALVDYHTAVCALRVPMQPRHLLGLWLVEEVYGRLRLLEGRHLIRFDGDGTFVAYCEGHRFPGSRGVWGRYTLDRSVLTTETEGINGDACLPGEKATWRATSFPDGRLHLAFLHGSGRPDHPGEVWVARRVLTHTP
jgi:hypothetical protein